MAFLHIQPGDGAPFRVELRQDALTIGRGTSNDLHFKNPWLSRFHARIERREGEYFLSDLGSRNGTSLNGRPLRDEQPLRSGDLIALGDIQLRFLGRSALKVSESDPPLAPQGTFMLDSEDLLLNRYRESVSVPSPEEASAASLLPALNAAAAELITHLPLDQLAPRVLELMVEPVQAERGALLLRSRTGAGELEIKAVSGYGKDEEVRISRTLIDQVLEGKKAVLTLDAQRDGRFEGAHSIMIQGIRSIICAPLWNNREVMGLIYLDSRVASGRFNETTLRLVGLIGNMAAIKIENAYLLEEQIEKRRMEEQLAIGAQIQRQLLPAVDPVLPGYDICGVYQSCYEVGGDYYDYIDKPDGKLALVIADVSGKGVGAALLMAVLKASLHTLLHTKVEPAALIEQLNRGLLETSPYNQYATVFYAELDLETHVLEYVNGGHTPGLLLSQGRVEELGSTGPIVGIVPQARFASRRVALLPGATLLLYTDGISERNDPAGEEFGLARLAELLTEEPVTDTSTLVAKIRRRLASFGTLDHFADDSTLLVVRRRLPDEAEESSQAGTLDVPLRVEPSSALG